MNYNFDKYEQYTFTRIESGYGIGLNDQQVSERLEQGAKNNCQDTRTRTVLQIILDNTFTFFNMLNVVIAALIISVSVGEYKNIMFIGVALCNTFLSIFQEVRAKKTIDKLTIVSRGKVTVIRNGTRLEIDQNSVVLDDVMFITMGNQICTDGVLLMSQGLEIDESSITGEADLVPKKIGDIAFSGGFVATGSAYVRVMAIGKDNYAQKLSINSKYEKKLNSQLMNALNTIVKTLTIVIIPIGLLLFMTELFAGSSYKNAILGSSAAMIGMIPEGLILLTGIAFSIGAINLGRRKTLVQAMPSIETLARVDVLCLDKTGTITDGSLVVREIMPLYDEEKEALIEKVSALINSLEDDNGTSRALKNTFKNNVEWELEDVLPFSSVRKYSGVTFKGKGSFLMGAPEFITKNLSTELKENISAQSKKGFRVILFAAYNGLSLQGDLNEKYIEPLGLILISDNIRKEAKETLQFFKDQGVTIKVISGDNPNTVSNISACAGLSNAEQCIDLSKIDENASEDYYREIAEKYTVFGRVSPFQKKELIKALRKEGHIVAMTGDGINDVMALREADCSIAMASGNDAARHVSDFVLLDSNFSSMTHVVKEGRRVVNNIERVACLYLVKTIYSTLLAIIFILLPLNYPFKPIQLTLVSSMMVGIPSFFLALSPNYQQISGKFINKVLDRSLPAALTIVFNIMLIQFIGFIFDLEYIEISTLSLVITAGMCFVLLCTVSIPFNKRRILMLFLSISSFFLAFVLFKEFFYFADFSLWLNLLMVMLLFGIYPMFYVASLASDFLQNKWKNRKKGR